MPLALDQTLNELRVHLNWIYAYVATQYRSLDPDGLLQQFGETHVHGLDGLSTIDEAALLSVAKDFPMFLAVVIDSRSHAIRGFGVEDGQIVEKTLEVVKDISESQPG